MTTLQYALFALAFMVAATSLAPDVRRMGRFVSSMLCGERL